MATELDALQLNLTASTSGAITSIDKLISTLQKLGDRLGMFSKTSDYATNIGNMAKSIDTLSCSINNIDSGKFKQLSSSIRSFVKASESLSNFKGFNAVQNGADGVSAAIRKVADEFSKQWGINGKNATEKLTSAIEKMYNSFDDSSALNNAFINVQNLVKQFADLSSQIGETNSQWQEVRKWISSSNIALPDMTGEWGDDYKRKRGILGISNTTTGTSRQGDFAEQVAQMNSALGTTFDVTKSEQDLLNDVVDYIERGRDKASELARTFFDSKTNADMLKDSIYSLMDSLGQVEKNAENINANFSNVQSSPLESITGGLESISGITLPDFSNMTVLASAISKIGGDSGTRARENLVPIADGIKAFTGINIPQLEGIETFANGLRSLGSKNVGVAAEALPRLAQGLREFSTVQIPTGLDGLTQLGQSLSVFGRKTAQQAVETIPILTTAFRGLINELASAPSVSTNLVQLTDALARFVSNVNRVGTSSNKASKGLRLFGNTASSVSKKTFSLAAAIGKIYATYFLLFRGIGKIKDAIDISSSLKEVENVVNTTFGSMTDKVNEFAQRSIKDFGMSELSAKQYASRFQAMGVAMSIPAQSIAKAQQQLNAIHPVLSARGYSDTADSIADMSINITKLTADMASFYNVAQEDVAKDLESIWTGQTRPLRAYGLDLTNATLQEWALKNGIDAKIKSMSQAEKTMLRYQYVMANTSAVQGDFAKTSLTWANQVRILGQNFQRLGAAIGSGFIAWLRPMIVQVNAAMDSIIAAVQKTVNALGKIFGWQMIVDTTGNQLIDDTEGVADAWDDATGSAKKYAKQLLGIDELNNLTTQDKSGSGADSGIGGGSSGGNIIEPGGIKFEKFESDIASLFQLGTKISNALRNALAGIDWDSVYQKAKNFGTGLASFLNGLIKPDTFYQIGKTIAGGLNTVIESALAFGKEGRWEQWGLSIASGINGFFENFNWEDFAQTINTWAQGLWTMIKTAVTGDENGKGGIDWKNVFSGLWDFFSNLDISTIGIIAGAITIKNAARWIIPQVQNLSLKAALVIGVAALSFEGGKKLGEFLNPEDKEIYANFNFSDFSNTDLEDYLGGAYLMIQDFKNNNALKFGAEVLFGPIGLWAVSIANRLKAIDEFSENVKKIFGEVSGFIEEKFNKISDWFNTYVFNPISMMASDLWTGISTLWGTVSGWINDHIIKPIVNFSIGLSTRVSQIFQGLWITIKGVWITVSGWFNTNVITPVINFFGNLKGDIENKMSTAWLTIKALWGIASGWFKSTVIQPTITNFTNFKNSVASVFTTAWNLIKTVWIGARNWFKTYVISPISLAFTGLWSGIKTGLKSAFNAVICGIESGINFIVSGINKIIGGFNKVISWAAKVAEIDWGGVDEIPKVSIPRISMYEYGGFPTQGSIFVAGETYGQSEWVGNVNGKTGVVSGYEITDISKTIRETSEQELMMLRQQNQLLSGILAKEFGITKNDIGRAAREYGIDYFNRTGNQAYVN